MRCILSHVESHSQNYTFDEPAGGKVAFPTYQVWTGPYSIV
jgi:hypothetical protein